MRDSEVKITILIWGAFLCRTRKSCAQPHPGLIHPAPGKTAAAPATDRWRSGSHVPLRAPASAGATPACQSSAGPPGFSRSCTARPGACRRDRGAAATGKLCRPRRQLQRPAVREAPLRRPDKAVPCIAGPQAGEDRQRFRRKGVISRGQQHRGISEPPLQALRHSAVHGAGRAQKIQTTPPAAPGCKPVQRLLRNALRQDGVVDDGHMSLQRARRDAGPAIRQKAEAEHGGPAGKCCNFFTICRQIHRNRQ